jgi:nitric oxide reductase subunit C
MAVDGKQVYEQKCQTCHSIGGVGGKMAKLGGPLDGVGSKRDATWLKEYFHDPKSKIADSKMPKLKLTDEEWDAVTQYVLSLKGGGK